MEKQPKKNLLKTSLTIFISLVFAGVFMYFALRGINKDQIIIVFKRADYLWVAFAFVFGLLAYWFRAIRWNLLLKPMGHPISKSNALWSLSFGYLMNLTIPRSGEVARATALYGVEKVPVDKSFGTIILERLVDLIFMFFFLFLTAIFRYDALIAFYKSLQDQPKHNAETSFPWKLLIIGFIICSAIVLYIFRKKITKSNIGQKIIGFLKGLLDGLKSILSLESKWEFIIYSFGIWISYYFATYLICFALPETSHFGFTDGFFIISVGTLGMMVPASGGIGAYHLALKFGFISLFLSLGLSPEEGANVGLAYAFLSHTLQLFIMLIMGIISIPILAKAAKV